ncbi:MAG: FAD-dependent oxidoreductase, partial [Parachlamydia sp.]|nr:FAD-dependent oxidoreductase [Parachlamydia sp.]
MTVIIIGGGFGGLNAAQALKKAPVRLLVIDKTNHHLFQPLLYQVASAALSPANIASPIRDILAKQANATVLLAEIVAIDLKNRHVISANGDHFTYDYLILSPGSSHAYFGHSDWEANAPGLKTLYDALRIRERILLSYERAERSENPHEAERFMRFVIIGAGPTGVEMAGAIAEMAHQSLVRNFRHIKPEQTKIYLIEGGSRVLPAFSEDLSEKALHDLQKLGVEVLLDSPVTKVTPEGVWLGDRFLESPNILWAAGNQASPLLESLHIPLDRWGRA